MPHFWYPDCDVIDNFTKAVKTRYVAMGSRAKDMTGEAQMGYWSHVDTEISCSLSPPPPDTEPEKFKVNLTGATSVQVEDKYVQASPFAAVFAGHTTKLTDVKDSFERAGVVFPPEDCYTSS